MHLQEFRMLEPEAIAVWWGYHKNKPEMTYDKFSRSLRYYYDKGILKKIPGERYLYRFLVDPEVMYHYMGSSECRPKIKPMPKSAKAVLGKFNKKKKSDTPGIAQEAESRLLVPLLIKFNSSESTTSCASNVQQTTRSSNSTGNTPTSTSTLPIKRCKSLDAPDIASPSLLLTTCCGRVSSCGAIPECMKDFSRQSSCSQN